MLHVELTCMHIRSRSSLASGGSVCTLDFSGSGMSDGEDVTWGYQEKKDLEVLLKHLSANAKGQEIASQEDDERKEKMLQRNDDLKRCAEDMWF